MAFKGVEAMSVEDGAEGQAEEHSQAAVEAPICPRDQEVLEEETGEREFQTECDHSASLRTPGNPRRSNLKITQWTASHYSGPPPVQVVVPTLCTRESTITST